MSFLSAPQINYSPASFSSGGLSAKFSGGKYNLSESPTLSGNIGSLQRTFGQQASDIASLRPTVAPGFSAFRQAGLADLTTQQQASQSNLRDMLAQRRVLGSSFANASASQQDAEFAQKRADFIAQSYLSELDASNKLIQEQYAAAAQGYQVAITQSNFEAGIAASLSQSANQTMASVATAQAQLDAQNAAGIGKLLGVGGAILANSGIGSSIAGLFGGGAASGSGAAAGGEAAGIGLVGDSAGAAAGFSFADVLPFLALA